MYGEPPIGILGNLKSAYLLVLSAVESPPSKDGLVVRCIKIEDQTISLVRDLVAFSRLDDSHTVCSDRTVCFDITNPTIKVCYAVS